MKIVKQKKSGISLIVLVITIIVMIILAAAIILSLDGSNIIERAKEGQSSNDVSTAKEIVSLAKSEWSFERQEGYDTFREYAESKLEEAGFDMDKTYVEDNGKVLFGTAARFAKAGVEIGTEVTGYTLNSTSSYKTSGKENTSLVPEGSDWGTETNPQPATITRDISIKWTYIGIDEDGNAMLAGSVTDTTPKVKLGGKGGYLNGPAELDAACEAMYSSSKGTARSIKIEDVTRVLEYTGERGAYADMDGNYITTKKPLIIGKIATQIGYDISNFSGISLENGKDIGSYKLNYFYIYKTNDVNEYNPAKSNLIYPVSTNATLKDAYWLSSSCVYADFSFESVDFYVRGIGSGGVGADAMFGSYDGSGSCEYALRPVVILNSDVQVSYNGTIATLQ